MLVPDGLTSIEAMDAWHTANDGRWMEYGPPRGPFVAKWLARQKDLVEKYRPDLVYFDDSGLPFGSAGLDAAAHYYNSAVDWRGQADVVLTAKKLLPVQRARHRRGCRARLCRRYHARAVADLHLHRQLAL